MNMRRVFLYPILALASLFAGCSAPDKPAPAPQARTEENTAVPTASAKPEATPAAESPLLPQVEQIVDKLLADPKKPLKITARSTWKELGADSLDVVEIVLECEDTFKIEIADEELDKAATVGDLARLVEKIQKSPPANGSKKSPKSKSR